MLEILDESEIDILDKKIGKMTLKKLWYPDKVMDLNIYRYHLWSFVMNKIIDYILISGLSICCDCSIYSIFPG